MNEDRLYLTKAHREFLLQGMQAQLEGERSSAFKEYFERYIAALRPRLEVEGPMMVTQDEIRYLLFTLGGIMGKARDSQTRKMHWAVLRKVIAVNEAVNEAERPRTRVKSWRDGRRIRSHRS